MKTIDFSYFIERYIAGEMDQSEKKWFETELEGNPTLQRELALRKKADSALVRHDIIDLRNKLAAIEKERKEKVIVAGGKTPRFRYAAVITALVLLGSLYLITTGPQSYDTLYKKNFEVYPYSGTSRSAEVIIPVFKTALDLYNKNEFTRSLPFFRDYLKSNPGEMRIKLLYGVALMESNNFNEAKSALSSIVNNSNNLYIDQAQWYLALCYVKTEESETAIRQLESIINSNSIYREKAKKLVRKIR